MSHKVVDTLNELRSQPAGLHKVSDGPVFVDRRSKTLASSDDVTEEEVWARYHEAVAEVRRAWGQPELGPTGYAYEGPGWRAGYKGECPSPDESLRHLYCQALRIGWWKRAGFVHAVMVTGHDANTLQILQLAVAEASKGA